MVLYWSSWTSVQAIEFSWWPKLSKSAIVVKLSIIKIIIFKRSWLEYWQQRLGRRFFVESKILWKSFAVFLINYLYTPLTELSQCDSASSSFFPRKGINENKTSRGLHFYKCFDCRTRKKRFVFSFRPLTTAMLIHIVHPLLPHRFATFSYSHTALRHFHTPTPLCDIFIFFSKTIRLVARKSLFRRRSQKCHTKKRKKTQKVKNTRRISENFSKS